MPKKAQYYDLFGQFRHPKTVYIGTLRTFLGSASLKDKVLMLVKGIEDKVQGKKTHSQLVNSQNATIFSFSFNYAI